MDKLTNILFWPAIGGKLGMGNYLRSLSVAAEVSKKYNPLFCLPRESPDPGRLADLSAIRIEEAELEMLKADCVMAVLDNQDAVSCARQAKKIKNINASVPILGLDYTGKPDENIDLYVSLRDYKWHEKYVSEGEIYFESMEFAIIRKEFEKYRPIKQIYTGQLRKILITFGGEDARNLTLDTLKWLEEYVSQALEITVILGMLHQEKECVLEYAKCVRKHEIKVYEHVRNIEDYMKSCDLAICSAGTTLMELAYLGKPAITLPQNEMEKDFLDYLKKIGYLQHSFYNSSISDNTDAMLDIFKNAGVRCLLIEKGMLVFDGRGSRRIAKIIYDFIEKSSQTVNGG